MSSETRHPSATRTSNEHRRRAFGIPALMVIVASFLAPASVAVAGGPWTITVVDLGELPGGLASSAYALNDNGMIAGTSMDSAGQWRTVRWIDGTVEVLASFDPSGLNIPEDMNDAGQIVGRINMGFGLSYGVLWSPSGVPASLDGLPNGVPQFVVARGINESGIVVGRAQESAPTMYGHAAVWSGTELAIDLGFMGGGTYSEAYGVNNFGHVVGVASIANTNQHAFLWKDGQYTDLSLWSGGGASSKAYAINDAGVIVGMNASKAAKWANGSVQFLPMPAGVSAFTAAVDINDAGDIIATATTVFPIETGVVWKDGVPMKLPPLPGGTTTRARRINQGGWVVGESNAADGFFHAVLWKIEPTVPLDPADLDGDGSVGPMDLAALVGAWGACGACAADLDDDGAVGPGDLAILLGSWS
jgi:probable HAF family extracellular repeat protein